MDVNAVPCLVTSQWTSSAQLLLSRINAPKHRNVLELLSFGTQLRAVPNGNSSSVRLLYHEYQVIGALLKKNRAQHRCGRWWQRLEGVRRSLKATFCGEARNGGASGTLMVPAMLHVLSKASQSVTSHQERHVPTQHALRGLLRVLYQFIQRLEVLLQRAHAAALACAAQLAHTFFMPLSMTAFSFAGRVYAIGLQILREGIGLYNLLQGELTVLLPSGAIDGRETDVMPPSEVRCPLKKGEIVRIEAIYEEGRAPASNAPTQPPGLRVLGADLHAKHSPLDLVVEEDHGQVVSRDEVYAALGLSGTGVGADESFGGSRCDVARHASEEVAPLFEESQMRIEEELVAPSPVEIAVPALVKEKETTNERMAKRKRGDANDIMEKKTQAAPVSAHAVRDAVQFVRIGATRPRPDADPGPRPDARPLITRLEEEKKRKRKKKKKPSETAAKKPSPWDDLF